MSPRVRMARKRLAIARERRWAAYDAFIYNGGKRRMWRLRKTKRILARLSNRKDPIA